MEESGHARVLGFASVSAYAEAAIDQSPSKTKKLVAVARAMKEMPKLREVADSGELGWTKLYLVACAATGDDDVGEWIETAKKVSKEKLEELAFGCELLLQSFKVTPEEAADIELALQAMWLERPEISTGTAIAEICRRFMSVRAGDATKPAETKAAPSGPTAPRSRLVVTICEACKKATREARNGSIEVADAHVERVACDAEILDIRRGPAPARRAIPPKIANFVDARDRGRCRFPGCTNRAFIDRHHQGGWRNVGHDPKHLFLLCASHHAELHDELITVSGDANAELTFRLRDKTKVERRIPRGPGDES